MWSAEASETCKLQIQQKMKELRIVLFGKSRSSKDALKDIILGTRETVASGGPGSTAPSASYCDREKCQVEEKIIDNQRVMVVDTPDLFQIGTSEEDVVEEIRQSIKLVRPGPHVFLFVEKFETMSGDEAEVLKVFKHIFGKKAMNYMMMASIKEQKKDDTEGNIEAFQIKTLTEMYNLEYFVFIRSENDQQPQVTELLEKIKEIKDKNRASGHECYSLSMLRKVEDAPNKEKIWYTVYNTCSVVGKAAGEMGGSFLNSELASTIGGFIGSMLLMVIVFLLNRVVIKIKKRCKKRVSKHPSV